MAVKSTDNTQKPDKEALDPEPMPPLDDDAEASTPQELAEARHEEEGEGEGEAAPVRRRDEARDAITARFKELQAIDRGEAPPEADEPDDVVIGRAEAEAASPDPEMKLLVFGNVIKRKRSELVEAYDLDGFDDARIINIAQKQMAADQRLAEAKEVADQRLADAGRQRSASEAVADHPTDQSGEPRPDNADELAPDRPPREAKPALNEETLDDIVQRVQFGDGDEAKQAFRDFADEIRSNIPAASAEDVVVLLEQRLSQRQHQTEIYDALKQFGEENPDLIGDKHLVTVGLDMARDEMLDDLRAIPGMKEEHLQPIAHDRQAVATAHRQCRLQGLTVRTVKEVLSDAASKLRTKFHLPGGEEQGSSQPHPASPSQARERLHRKELAPQQPRHGGARVGATPQAERPRTALEIINEKRHQGGFPTHR